MLKVNEIFYSIQGEGHDVGAPHLFVRLSGCNMACSFCDTDHKKGIEISVDDLLQSISVGPYKFLPVVLTGGEPLMQPDVWDFIEAVRNVGRRVVIETNGTFPLRMRNRLNTHVCVSPKIPLKHVKIGYINSLKLLYPFLPGCGLKEAFELDCVADHIYIQPIDNDPKYVQDIVGMLKWSPGLVSLSVQVHKLFKLL